MVSGFPPHSAHEVLSEPPSCTRMSLRVGHATNHEGIYVSLWVSLVDTARSTIVCANSMVEVSMEHSPCGLLCHEGACKSWPLGWRCALKAT